MKIKYEFVDEHPNYKDLKKQIKDLKKLVAKISKDIDGDEGEEYVTEFVINELFPSLNTRRLF